jgi:hypothetical protein
VTDWNPDEGLTIVTFENEQGETIDFAQVLVFEVDDAEYAALAPMEELGDGDVELFLFQTGVADEQRFYVPLEDDALIQRLFDIAVMLLEGTESEG